jgi:iron complex outermembrane receptor protein
VAVSNDEAELMLLYGDEDFVSIATGQQQLISKAPAVATVITAKQIKEMGAIDLDQVLESVPGLHVSLSSTRFSPVYSMRGIHTDKNPQVLMLVNGTPITQAFLGDRGVRSSLPVNSIARVEVIRGPGSAVYGADAFAGVINVITKSADDVSGGVVGASGGSFNTERAWVMYGGELGAFDVLFSVEYSDTEGDDDRTIDVDAQIPFDLVFGTMASLSPDQAETEHRRTDIRLDVSRENTVLRLWNWRQDLGHGPGAALAIDPYGKGETDNLLAELVYKNSDFGENWGVEAKLTYMDVDTESTNILRAQQG